MKIISKKLKLLNKIVIVLLLLMTFSQATTAFALTAAQLKAQKDYYAAQAAAAAAAAEKKRQQAAVVAQQIQNVSTNITQTQAAMAVTDTQLSQTQAAIDDLKKQIAEQESNLAAEKDKLNNVVTSLYMEGDNGLFESVLASDSLSEIITTQQYYESIGQQINSTIAKIDQLKAELKIKKDEADAQLAQLTGLRQSQAENNNYLASQKTMKTRLLSDTNNAISDLQDEQKVAEQKVAELQAKIAQIRSSSSGGGGDLISGSAGYYFQQNDGRWNDYKIGRYATIGDYGCLLTSLTMISDYYGNNYNPMTAAQVSSFNRSGGSNDGALISTPIVHDYGSRGIDWDEVDSELSSGHPVVLGVALGVDMGNSYGVSHFVVALSKLSDGRYTMLDPLGSGRGYYKSQVKAYRVVRP